MYCLTITDQETLCLGVLERYSILHVWQGETTYRRSELAAQHIAMSFRVIVPRRSEIASYIRGCRPTPGCCGISWCYDHQHNMTSLIFTPHCIVSSHILEDSRCWPRSQTQSLYIISHVCEFFTFTNNCLFICPGWIFKSRIQKIHQTYFQKSIQAACIDWLEKSKKFQWLKQTPKHKTRVQLFDSKWLVLETPNQWFS